MIELKQIERKGTEAVKRLRLQKLRMGRPFMINSRELVTGYCYFEFPDGTIKLARYNKLTRDFEIIKELSEPEIQLLRHRYHLYV